MSDKDVKPEPPTHGQLSATGKDGQTVSYEYTCERDTHLTGGYESKTKWCFSILIEQDVFQFDLVDEGSFMRVEMMSRQGCERYKARGIAEAFIRLSSQIFCIPIRSSTPACPKISSSGVPIVEELHSEDARKVWKRLVARNEAYYDDETQRFTYPAV
jgi:hypothetical protein